MSYVQGASAKRYISPLYSRARWLRRRKAQLQAEPLCCVCLAAGRVVAATEADHIERHNGNEYAFFFGPLQSMCKRCHSSKTQGQDVLGYSRDIGADGYPLDPKHPMYHKRTSND